MSLHHGDWMKLLGGAGLAAAGLFAPEIIPALASGLGVTGPAIGTGVATGAAGSSLASLVAPSLISTGIGTGLSGAAGTPSTKMTSPAGVPPLDDSPDPMALFEAIKRMQHGGLS